MSRLLPPYLVHVSPLSRLTMSVHVPPLPSFTLPLLGLAPVALTQSVPTPYKKPGLSEAAHHRCREIAASRAGPSRAEPSRAEPGRAEPSRAETSRAELNRAEPS